MSFKQCETCHGLGSIEAYDRTHLIPVEQDCLDCMGTGQAIDDDMPEMSMEASDDASCPICGAPHGEQHDPGCPEEDKHEPDPDRFRESAHENVGFDKFMNRIILQERRTQKVDGKENNPQRLIAGNYQERPLGRIRYGVKR